MKDEILMNIQQKREMKLRQIMDEVNLLKRQNSINEELRQNIKMEETMQNKNKCEFVKTQQYMFEEKKRAMEVNFISYNIYFPTFIFYKI